MKGLLGWLWSNTEFSFVSDPRDITKDLLLRNEVQDSWYYLDTHRQLAGLLAVHIQEHPLIGARLYPPSGERKHLLNLKDLSVVKPRQAQKYPRQA